MSPSPFPFGHRGPFSGGHVGAFGPGGPGTGLFFVLLVVALAVLGFLLFARQRDRDGARAAHHETFRSDSALQILDERLARGEIDVEDYTTRRSLLLSRT